MIELILKLVARVSPGLTEQGQAIVGAILIMILAIGVGVAVMVGS